MSSEQTICPNCGATLDHGAAFCSSCGRRASEPAKPLQNSSQACPFELSAALPGAMQVGRRSIVVVKFRALADIYESVEFVLRNGDEELVRRSCCSGRPFTFEHQVSLDVKPNCCGAARIALDIVCRVGDDGETEIHTAVLQLSVDAQRSGSFSPVFNINQTQTSDRAGDTKGGNINVNLGGLNLNPQEDISRYETPTRFERIAVTLRKSPARLTLKGVAGVVQLISDDMVTFGRSRDNIIPLRIFGSDGSIDMAANEHNISRYHFRLKRTERDCLVSDGGAPSGSGADDRVSPSAYGTRIDGEKLSPAGSACIDSDRCVNLSIGREGVELNMKLWFARDDWGRPSGVVLDREDGANQRVYVVWRDIPLASGERILWNGSHWAVSYDSGEARQIAIGSPISIGGEEFEVLPFHQTYVK